VEIVRAREASVMPWRNGGGITREYFRVGGDDFEWRLSMAQIDVDGPFSAFPMINRSLVLLSGAVDLTIDGTLTRLAQPLDAVDFPGEASVDAAVVSAPSTDLNLMWRRDRFHVRRSARTLEEGAVLMSAGVGVGFAVSGECSLVDGDLEPCDAWWFTGSCEVLAGEAAVVLFDLAPHGA
jgi:environmental stress-induced protein Ves